MYKTLISLTSATYLMLLRNILRKQSFLRNKFRCNTSVGFPKSQEYSNASTMAEHAYTGNTLSVILSRLQEFAPLDLACAWDNVGLLVDPMSDVKITNILLTNDLTEDVVEEAVSKKCALIISYHPNIFHGLKTICQKSWKERVVVQCIKNEIAVFSPHTSWDAVRGGVNDWLANALSIKKSLPIVHYNEDTGSGRCCTLEAPITVKEAVRLIKAYIGISHLRLALAKNGTEDSYITTVAVCAGSGSSVLGGVEADLYLTGEMLHHDILDATQNGTHVILCNHSDSERGFLTKFQKKLESEILKGEAKVFVSKLDRDPLKTV